MFFQQIFIQCHLIWERILSRKVTHTFVTVCLFVGVCCVVLFFCFSTSATLELQQLITLNVAKRTFLCRVKLFLYELM